MSGGRLQPWVWMSLLRRWQRLRAPWGPLQHVRGRSRGVREGEGELVCKGRSCGAWGRGSSELARGETESQLLRASGRTRPENCIGFGTRESPSGEGEGKGSRAEEAPSLCHSPNPELLLHGLMTALRKTCLFPWRRAPSLTPVRLCLGHIGGLAVVFES